MSPDCNRISVAHMFGLSFVDASHNKALYELIRNKIPYGEWGDVEYIGACAVYLASEASNYVTGVTIPVDGGFLYNGA